MAESELRNRFACNLLTLLRTNNMKQSELASRLNVSRTTVSAWCAGLKIPRMDKIEEIADIFNVNVALLLLTPSPAVIVKQEAPDLVEEFVNLDEDDQKNVQRYIRFLLSAEKYHKEKPSPED